MDFQPYTVTCLTCESRLRVARADLVDAIVQCPKCQSMVQLARPEPSDDPAHAIALGNRSVDSNAITEDSITPPVAPDGHAEPTVSDRSPPVVSESADIPPEQNPPHAPPISSAAPPPPDWHSQKTAKSRRVAMSIAVVLASIVSATLLFSALFRGDGPVTDVDPAETSRNGQPSGVTPDADPTNAQTLENGGAPDTSSTPENEQPSTDSGTNPDGDSPEAAQPDGGIPKTDTADADGSPIQPSTDSAQPPSQMEPPQELLPSNPLLPDDPLKGLFTPGGTGNADPKPAAEDLSKMTELPDGLKEIFGGLSGMERPQFTDTEPAPPTLDEFEVDRAADQLVNLENAVEAPDPINMRAAFGLQVAMQSADPEGYPLNDLMLVVGQLSGVPIELEWVSFEICGTTLDQPIPLPKGWPTLEEVLAQSCETIGASYEMKPRSVVVQPTDEQFERAVQETIDLSDLAEKKASAVALARTLLGQTDGDQSVVTHPTERVQQQIAAIACDAIRRMYQKPGKIDDAAFARWAGPFSEQQAGWPKLTGGVSGDPRLQPASLAALIRQIAKQNAATCFVNWQDATTGNLMPNAQRMPRTGKEVSAAEVMTQLLDPAGLHVRMVDEHHWWIGSQASFDRFPVVVWFDGQADARELTEQLRAILQSAAGSGPAVGSVAYDPATDKTLALMPRYLLRQIPRLLDEIK